MSEASAERQADGTNAAFRPVVLVPPRLSSHPRIAEIHTPVARLVQRD